MFKEIKTVYGDDVINRANVYSDSWIQKMNIHDKKNVQKRLRPWLKPENHGHYSLGPKMNSPNWMFAPERNN